MGYIYSDGTGGVMLGRDIVFPAKSKENPHLCRHVGGCECVLFRFAALMHHFACVRGVPGERDHGSLPRLSRLATFGPAKTWVER